MRASTGRRGTRRHRAAVAVILKAIVIAAALTSSPAAHEVTVEPRREPVIESVPRGGFDVEFTAVAGRMFVLAPAASVSEVNVAGGCWVQLYDGREFSGKYITLVGPASLSTLRVGTALDWRRQTRSLIVGPMATLTSYSREHFVDKDYVFGPGMRVAQVRGIPLGEPLASLRIDCGAVRVDNP